ncbi:MAG: NAD(P)/FAD-dependent oxidoreductase, partial [Bacteroidia bacterium]|nr:NAD(P)/FAD-dependent oxidoreductase [Bacteroidia bacterium]
MAKTTVVIGGGVAGITAASRLADLGEKVILLEREEKIGGHLRNWNRLFPNRRPGHEVLNFLTENLGNKADLRCNRIVSSITKQHTGFHIELDEGESITCDALLLATGFDLFDARKKEEYGYGIYDNVITSA